MTISEVSNNLDLDACILDFLGYAPDPQRYDTNNRVPYESTLTITDLVPEGARILDIGCGIGTISACV